MSVVEAQASFRGERVDSLSGDLVKPIHVGRGRRVLRSPANGTRLGLIITVRRDVLVWTDGPLACLLASEDALVPTSSLVAGASAATAMATSLGVDLSGCDVTIRRMDLAVDVCFESASSGHGFLRGMAALTLPCLRSVIYRGRGTPVVEDVSFSNAQGGTVLRAHDRAKRLGDVPGSVIRIEREWWPAKGRKQPWPAQVQQMDIAALFAAPFEDYATERCVVADPLSAYWILTQRIGETIGNAGQRTPMGLTERVAENLTGSAAWLAADGDRAWSDPRKARQRRRDLAALGVAVGAGLDSPVPVGGVLRAAARAWRHRA